MSSERTPIRATHLTRPFWDATRDRKFLLQFDPESGRYQFYPRRLSLYSNSYPEWREANGQGTLVAYSLCYTPAPGFKDKSPYMLVIVQLDEGPRVLARAASFTDQLVVGQRMHVVWGDIIGDGREFLFAPSAEQSSMQDGRSPK